jgi:hypothetical protein
MEPESPSKNKTPASPSGEAGAAGLGVTPAEKSHVIELPKGRIVLYWNERGERGASFRGFVPYEVRELVFDELRLHLVPRVEILENKIKSVMRWLEDE